jgi:hypothetical protein
MAILAIGAIEGRQIEFADDLHDEPRQVIFG